MCQRECAVGVCEEKKEEQEADRVGEEFFLNFFLQFANSLPKLSPASLHHSKCPTQLTKSGDEFR